MEDVRAAKDRYAAQFGYDLERIFEDLTNKQDEDPAPRAKLKPLEPH